MIGKIAQLGIAALSLFFMLQLTPAVAQPQQQNFRSCQIWCTGTGGCVACSSYAGCSANYTSINTFRNGNVWFACRARNSRNGRRSEDNRRRCLSYCASNSRRCDMCSTLSSCGPNYRRMASFGGRGTNWYACEDDQLNTTGSGPRQRTIRTGTVSIPGW